MLYNIANTPKYKFIEEQTVKISKELGFAQEDTLQLTLSSVMGAGYKYEPILYLFFIYLLPNNTYS